MSKTYHICVDIRGTLNRPNKDLHGMMRDNKTGRRLTAKEVRNVLYDKLSEGWDVLPVGESCEGFDKKHGCQGHEEPTP